MVMSRQLSDEPSISIAANNIKIEQVQLFKYLGSWLTADARCEKEIRQGINLAKSSFNRMKNIFRDCKLSMHPKTRLLKCSCARFSCMVVKRGHLQQRLEKT